MLIEQLFDPGLGHASYVCADPDAGVAFVVDPGRDIDLYLEAATRCWSGTSPVSIYLGPRPPSGFRRMRSPPSGTACSRCPTTWRSSRRMAEAAPAAARSRARAGRRSELRERMGELPRDRALVTYCASGARSALAASMLAADGREVRDLRGGLTAWRRAGLPESR